MAQLATASSLLFLYSTYKQKTAVFRVKVNLKFVYLPDGNPNTGIVRHFSVLEKNNAPEMEGKENKINIHSFPFKIKRAHTLTEKERVNNKKKGKETQVSSGEWKDRKRMLVNKRDEFRHHPFSCQNGYSFLATHGNESNCVQIFKK